MMIISHTKAREKHIFSLKWLSATYTTLCFCLQYQLWRQSQGRQKLKQVDFVVRAGIANCNANNAGHDSGGPQDTQPVLLKI